MDLATTGETSLENILIGGVSGAAGAFGTGNTRRPPVDDGYTIESGYLPLQTNRPNAEVGTSPKPPTPENNPTSHPENTPDTPKTE